ncbi:MAG: hypothetical protein M1828_003723 [Chrysothrix sp. TS-e1954]|nr:MAG: hypothetical protein M1828_003723 [Chrysothrix sp. TS-e1954]
MANLPSDIDVRDTPTSTSGAGGNQGAVHPRVVPLEESLIDTNGTADGTYSSMPHSSEQVHLDRPHAYAPSTVAVHADDALNTSTDVAPSIHLSTTFRYSSDPSTLTPAIDKQPTTPSDGNHVYSRLTNPNAARLETVLSSLLNAHALTYSSGLAAFHALMVFFKPRTIAIGQAYHGCYGVLGIHEKLTGLRRVDLHAGDAVWDHPEHGVKAGDVVHVETPVNPTGLALDLGYFARRAHRRGAYLSVDSTFAPPSLQDPFAQGADVVMHSGTKYLGGHSDMLCGVLAVKRADWWEGLHAERRFLGSIVGGLEGWLGVRSLRTLELRVSRQSENATALVAWLDSCLKSTEDVGDVMMATVKEVLHASLQTVDLKDGWLTRQMPGGFGPVFAIVMTEERYARKLPSKLDLFHHATSLGGVESLIEWRSMSDEGCDRRLMRVSVGVENVDDLKKDLGRAIVELVREEAGGGGTS